MKTLAREVKKIIKAKMIELYQLSEILTTDEITFGGDCYFEQLQNKMKHQDKLITEIEALSKQHDTILGRIIRFPHADSYAVYLVVKLYKANATLLWLNYCDGWQDDRLGLCNDIDVNWAINEIERKDKLAELFS